MSGDKKNHIRPPFENAWHGLDQTIVALSRLQPSNGTNKRAPIFTPFLLHAGTWLTEPLHLDAIVDHSYLFSWNPASHQPVLHRMGDCHDTVALAPERVEKRK